MKKTIILLLVLLLGIGIVQAKTFTANSEEECVDGVCNLILYSGTRFTDSKGTLIEDTPSLMDCEFCDFKWDIDYDGMHQVEIQDFNMSMMLITLSLDESKLGEYEYEVEEGKIKVKFKYDVYEDVVDKKTGKITNDLVSKEFELELEEGKNTAYMFNINPFGKEFHIGENSTTIKLQTANTENIGDSYVVSASPNDNFGNSTTWACAGAHIGTSCKMIIGFNTTAVLGNTILESKLYTYTYLETLDEGESLTYTTHFGDHDWIEMGVTWNNFPSYNSTSTDSYLYYDGDGVGWLDFDVTNSVRHSVSDLSLNNATIVISGNSGAGVTDRVYLAPKEYETTSLRPYLNITYEAGCTPSLVNTSWTAELNISCQINDNMQVMRNLTQYDENSCGGANTTFYNYTNISSCNYCSYDVVNTTWSDWINYTICYVNDSIGMWQNLTMYDQNYSICFAVTGLQTDNFTNVTFYNYSYTDCDNCTPSLTNTSWTSPVNLSECQANDTVNQFNNVTQYDSNFCGEVSNTTYFNYSYSACDYCVPSIVNTSWSAYTNNSICYVNDTLQQISNLTQYDENICVPDNIENVTFYNYTWISCVNDSSAPQYFDNSTNSTGTGEDILFSLRWTDETSLSGYIFSFSNETSGEGGSIYDDCNSIPFDSSKWSFITNTGSITEDGSAYFINASGGTLPSEMTLATNNTYNFTSVKVEMKPLKELGTGRGHHISIGTGAICEQDFCNDNTGYSVSYGYAWCSMDGADSKLVRIDNCVATELDTDTWEADYASYYELTLTVNNSGVFFYVDGVLKLNATDNNYSNGGYVTISTGGGSSNLGKMYINNVWDEGTPPVVFYNDSWVSFSGKENWSNVTKNPTSDFDKTIQWCIYANDTHNYWNVSSCNNPFSYVTSACTPSLVNTSWTDELNISCQINDTMLIMRNLTQYDENMCGGANTTFYNYTNISSCNYCSYSLTNTSWSAEYNYSCTIEDNYTALRNLTMYDENYSTCYAVTGLAGDLWNSGDNMTFSNYTSQTCNYCSYSVVNTSWSAEYNYSCTIEDNYTALRNLTEYDENYASCYAITSIASDLWNSGDNNTYSNYTNQTCNYCSYSLTNTSWSAEYNYSCTIEDNYTALRNLTMYDSNYDSCFAITGIQSDNFTNTTFSNYTSQTCNYCSYSVVNTSWSSYINISCLDSNLMNQSANKTEYDQNYETCYAITNIASDLYNGGANNTYYNYTQSLGCNYLGCPNITSIINVSTNNISSMVNFSASEDVNYSIYVTSWKNNNSFANAHSTYWDSLTNFTTYYVNLTVWDDYGCSASNNTFSFTTGQNPLCSVSLVNTSWTSLVNLSCQSNNTMLMWQNLTQWDSNQCGSANVTYYNYTSDVACNYLGCPNITSIINSSTDNQSTYINFTASESVNYSMYVTSWVYNNTFSAAHGLYWGSLNNNTAYSVNLTVWDDFGCSTENNTFTFTTGNYVSCISNITNTSWGNWTDYGVCQSNSTQMEIRNLTQLDFGGCTANITFYQYNSTKECEYDVDDEYYLYFATLAIFLTLLILGISTENRTFLTLSGILLLVAGINLYINGFPELTNTFLQNGITIVLVGLGAVLAIAPNLEELEVNST